MAFPTWPPARNMLIDSSVCGFTSKSMGSDTTSAPFGIVNDGDPLNVSVCSVFVSIAGFPGVPPSGRAMVAPVMGKFVAPNAFEMRRRMYDSAAIDVWMVWRIVEFVKIELVPF